MIYQRLPPCRNSDPIAANFGSTAAAAAAAIAFLAEIELTLSNSNFGGRMVLLGIWYYLPSSIVPFQWGP